MRYVFGDYALDAERYELRHAGAPIPLRPKVFHLLAYLLAHRGRIVSRQEPSAHLWPRQFASATTLDSCLAQGHQAVGDSGRTQRVVQTRHGYGYRFVAAVEVHDYLPGNDAMCYPHLSSFLVVQDAGGGAIPAAPHPCPPPLREGNDDAAHGGARGLDKDRRTDGLREGCRRGEGPAYACPVGRAKGGDRSGLYPRPCRYQGAVPRGLGAASADAGLLHACLGGRRTLWRDAAEDAG